MLYYFFTQQCLFPRAPLAMPGGGELLTCVNVQTSTDRRVFDHNQCRANEIPDLIPESL